MDDLDKVVAEIKRLDFEYFGHDSEGYYVFQLLLAFIEDLKHGNE